MIWLKIMCDRKARIVFLGKNVTDLVSGKFLFGAELCAGFFLFFAHVKSHLTQ